ncbi:MAG: hypothetical protein WD042_14850 [Phycisphaeraceae bacterium]
MEQTYNGGDRRPIASRQAGWSKASARWLARRDVSPNAISIAGMIACILGGAALAATPYVDDCRAAAFFRTRTHG